MAAVMGFCEYLREATANCDICHENRVNVCQIKVALQPYFRGFALYDTVIISRNAYPVVETDIEVTYKTDYPYGMHAGKGAEFAAEQSRNEKAIREYLHPRLPSGVIFKPSHLHYSPDTLDPNIVALHIHVMKRTADLDEAVLIAKQLVEAVQPREIEQALFKAGHGR